MLSVPHKHTQKKKKKKKRMKENRDEKSLPLLQKWALLVLNLVMAGDLSAVFSRHAEAGVSHIWSDE